MFHFYSIQIINELDAMIYPARVLGFVFIQFK
jgi:hypothetical protein